MLPESTKSSMSPYKVSETIIVDNHVRMKKLASALIYAFMSVLITFINKIVLKLYRFPSFQVLGLGQMLTSIIILKIASNLKVVTFPPFERRVARLIYPLPILYLGSMFIELLGTGGLNEPTFTALRRISIVMTMFAERYVIGITCSWLVQFSVLVLVLGGLIAAAGDVILSITGYLLVFFNDICTAAWAVCVKKKLVAKDLGRHGLMYYNSIFMLIPSAVIAWWSGDLQLCVTYNYWDDPFFQVHFFLSCIMGFILTYSVFLCTQYNSALTTAVISCLKNTLFTYSDLYFGSDYILSTANFIGLNISIVASLFYIFMKLFIDKS